MCRIDAGLTDPSNLQGNQRAKEFFGLVHVRRDIVVDEKDERLLDAADLFDDLVHRTPRLRIAEVRLNGAELATKVATPARFYQPDRQVAFAGKNGPVGTKAGERGTVWLAIDPAQSPVAKIVQDSRPKPLGFAHYDRFGIIARFIGYERWMKASHHDRNPTPPKLGSDLIGALRRIRFDAHRHQIRRLIEGNGFRAI